VDAAGAGLGAVDDAPWLPPGRVVELAGRGETFVRELPGPPGAPTVMLLHGWTVTADINWFPSYAALGRRFRVLAPDHRGHGRGPRSWKPFRLEDCADDAAALAEATATDSVIAVGYSMGGPVAQLLWKRHPDLVDGLVLCATGYRLTPNDAVNLAMVAGSVGLSVVTRLLPEPVRRSLTAAVVERRLEASPRRRWAASELARHDPAAIIEAGAALRTFDSSGWVAAIDVPAAVLVTKRDRVVAPATQEALARGLPDAAVHPVDGDHSVCVEDADAFVPVLLDALAGVAARGRSSAASAPAEPGSGDGDPTRTAAGLA
jgi:pimeloyl-ACP methyl ester carboxylesterase